MYSQTDPSGGRHLVQPTHAQVRLFGPFLRWIWICCFSITVAIEALPRNPNWGPEVFYPYTSAKVILFLLLGFLTPLAIWKFSSLGLGFVLAATAAGLGESVQHFLQGHRASLFEFAAKVALLFLGFAVALVVRNDHYLQVGAFRLLLPGRQLPRSSELQ